MNRSTTSPRPFSTNLLRAALGDVSGPARADYLSDIVEQAGRVRQRPAWTLPEAWFPSDIEGRRRGVPRAAVLFVVLSALVALLAAGALYLGGQPTQPDRPLGLPTTPEAWERVAIEIPSVTGRVASLAVSPHGLLAAVGGDEPARLVFSSDGRSWTLVPDGQHPRLGNDAMFGMPSLLGTERGFLMLQLNEVWLSENGYDWRRLAGGTADPDLRLGGPDTAVVGGPGLVAVGDDGDDKAWYSIDGSDWSVAAVPALPDEILARPESDRYIAMRGVTAAGNDLVAWGLAEVPWPDGVSEGLVVPLLWASPDGRTWANVADPEMDSITAVTGGPHGFVATGQAGSEAAVWRSADGVEWERVGDGSFTQPVRLELNAAAATSAGYVVVGTDGQCAWYPCPAQAIVIWTSPDGRSWSRVPSTDLLSGAQVYGAVAWGSSFLIGGMSDGKPAIWISGSAPPGSGANAGAAPALVIPTATPGHIVNLAGTWEASDPSPDSSHLTMELVVRPGGGYDVTSRDDVASVCHGASLTMTGVAESGGPTMIVIAQPEYTCDDGFEARALSGPPLQEQLRLKRFSYDSLRDALYDPSGLEWNRAEVAP